MTKICKQCKKEKYIEDFEKAKTCKDGRMSTCKKCRLENKKKYNNTCETCGIVFKTKNKDTRFCNKKCLPQNRPLKYKIECTHCGEDVMKTKSQIERSEYLFCSNECKNIFLSKLKLGENHPRYSQIKTTCSNCDGDTYKTKTEYEKYEHHYCSRECKYEHQASIYYGEKHPRYNPNLTNKERLDNRKYVEYYKWRNDVFNKDEYTCRKCGDKRGKNLNAHHIRNYGECEELRLDIKNGITLCESCHREFHKKFGYKNNNMKQLEEFMLIPSEACRETAGTCND
ncbi:MAG: HNH endonuclease [Paraclostridium sp.]